MATPIMNPQPGQALAVTNHPVEQSDAGLPRPAGQAASPASVQLDPSAAGSLAAHARVYADYDYDLVIIGGGPGGYVAAIRAGQLGLKTAVVEEQNMGGTCLNWGCIPTKSLLHAAELVHQARHSASYGVIIPEVQIDYPAIIRKKDQIVRQLRSGVEHQVRQQGCEIIRGRARFLDAHTLAISEPANRVVRAAKTIIATGSSPAKPPIPGIDGARILTSDSLLALAECPDSLVIIGGGVIGVEFATVYSQLGKTVTIIEMLPEILPGIDAELIALLRKKLAASGVRMMTGARVTALESSGRAICTCEINGETVQVEADKILVAVGRRPNSADLGLEQAGVQLDKGFIVVNDEMQTSVPSIYAVGDVTGKVMLAHAASEQGLVAASQAAGEKHRMAYDIIPSCIYTEVELACVGLTEEAAQKKGLAIRVGRFPISANGKSKLVGAHEGIAKIVTEARTGEILGAHIMAPRATDMIAEICVAMKLEATYEEVAGTIHPHPTVSEILMEAAQDVEHRSIHTPWKK